jgi:predicted glycogen debranching enzyme
MKNTSIKLKSDDPRFLYDEWLITNGLGGYACGSVSGVPMRKYHGLLVSSLKAPFGRAVMLNYVEDTLILSGNREIPLTQLRTKERRDLISPEMEFKLEPNFPVWSYQIGDVHLEKRVWMPHGQNTVYIRYHLISGSEPVSIKWRPFFHFRTSEQSVATNEEFVYGVHSFDGGYEISQILFPIVRLLNDQHPPFTGDLQTIENVYYEIEEKRGYECYGPLTSPGFFMTTIQPLGKTTFAASTETWGVLEAMTSEEALIAEKQRQKSVLKAAKPLLYSEILSKLVLAADQFVITPISREKDAVRQRAIGEHVRSIIAGYPWFTDWGRDTMISLEGLTLVTGRPHIAHDILRTFAYYIHQGLIPNMFPDGQNEGLYHTADATLWFFHAVDRYVTLTKDDDFLEYMIPKFQQIIEHHLKGTLFGIKMGSDGLLSQGQEGYQLTWMDAKVADWIVTPRRGKAVEINALWYNALKLMELWTGRPCDIAKTCYESFNELFWYEEGGYLYDVVSQENEKDASLRPNQILSLSLRFPVLKNEYWKPVVDIVKKELLTAYGLRTLSRSHPDFKSYYQGDIWARDAAYHQGTVWPWLIGPFIDAWLKVYPDQIEEAKTFLTGIESHIDEQCTGSLAEVFDALDPYHARGCFAQAWSVAEFLRSYVKVHTELQNR